MGTQYMNLQDAQKGRPARPQQAKRLIVLAPYGEPLSAARTPLVDFFRILLSVTLSSPHTTPRFRHGQYPKRYVFCIQSDSVRILPSVSPFENLVDVARSSPAIRCPHIETIFT